MLSHRTRKDIGGCTPPRAEARRDNSTHNPSGVSNPLTPPRQGTHLQDWLPIPLAAPPRLSAQGQGAGTSVGWRGWTMSGRRGHHRCIVSRLTLSLSITTAASEPRRMCGLGIAFLHFTKPAHTPHTASPPSLQALPLIRLWKVALFLADGVWEGQSHGRRASLCEITRRLQRCSNHITRKSAERPPRTISTPGLFLKYSPSKTN